MSIVDATELWLDGHYDDLIAWRRHIHAPTLSWGDRSFATTQFVASHWRTRASTRRCCPAGRADLDFGPSTGTDSRFGPTWMRFRWPSGPARPTRSVVPTSPCVRTRRNTAILLGAALALASVPELPVGVRLIFQAAEELMPGGAIDAIAAGALTGVSRIFALHCDRGWRSARWRCGRDRSRRRPIRSRSPCSRTADTRRGRI